MNDQTQTAERPSIPADPMGGDMGQMDDLSMTPPDNLPATAGQVDMKAVGHLMTAQKVVVPRNIAKIMQNLKVLCAAAGRNYVYSWPVKDRQNNRTSTVSGGTIKLANDLARTYGNCYLGIEEVVDTGTHWQFKAVFTDLETGFTLSRPFQQSKDKNVGKGMRDQSRAEDLIYQIGASKALRNVVLNALSTFADFMVEESQHSLLDWVNANEEKANQFINGVMDSHSIDIKRIEALIGRERKKWTMKNLVTVMMELRGIKEGMTSPDDSFPSLKNAGQVMAEKQAEQKDVKADKPKADSKKSKAESKDKSKGAKKDEKPKTAEPATETEPETKSETESESEPESAAAEGEDGGPGDTPPDYDGTASGPAEEGEDEEEELFGDES